MRWPGLPTKRTSESSSPSWSRASQSVKTPLRRRRWSRGTAHRQRRSTMTATLEKTHKAIGAEVRPGTYDIVIDGQRAGSIDMNDTIEMQVSPGVTPCKSAAAQTPSRTQTFEMDPHRSANPPFRSVSRKCGNVIWTQLGSMRRCSPILMRCRASAVLLRLRECRGRRRRGLSWSCWSSRRGVRARTPVPGPVLVARRRVG